MAKPYRVKWLFCPTKADEQIIDNERQRLVARSPGVTFTRADVIRSLFVRAEAYQRAMEADRAKEDVAFQGNLLPQLAARKETEINEVA